MAFMNRKDRKPFVAPPQQPVTLPNTMAFYRKAMIASLDADELALVNDLSNHGGTYLYNEGFEIFYKDLCDENCEFLASYGSSLSANAFVGIILSDDIACVCDEITWRHASLQ